MGIGAVLCPTVFLAFIDRAELVQDRPGPTLDRPEGPPPLRGHQHRNRSSLHAGRILEVVPPFRAANTGQGF